MKRMFKGAGLVAAACLLIGLTGVAHAQATVFTNPEAPQQSFDVAWKKFVETRDAPAKSFEEQFGVRPRLLARMALDIFEGYPGDPRRWNAAAELMKAQSGYAYGRDASKTGMAAILRDNAGRIAWNTYAHALYEQLVAAPDVPREAAKAGIAGYFGRVMMTFDAKPESLAAVVDEYTRRFPDDPELAQMESGLYSRAMEGNAIELADGRLPKLLQSSNPAVRAFAQAKMLVKVGRNRPIDMTFTALDGREVDLAKLRGKVVLIDFWATWCGPCMAEVPHIKKLYEQYQQQGFEIVGISLDAAPKGNAASAEEKSAEKLRTFLKDNGMSWPNYYDGKAWNNDMAKKYAVTALPTKFILDKNGLLVALNLSGEALDNKVKELLAAKPGQAKAEEDGQPAQTGGAAVAFTAASAGAVMAPAGAAEPAGKAMSFSATAPGPAQGGIEFFTGTWKEALAKAKAENKPIFVDVYTSWCGPCKLMAKDVFPLGDVGAKFNAGFINYKVDAEKGEGVEIARQFGVNAYPTYLFVNGEGVLCYRAMGSMPAADFMAQADKALVEFKDPKPLPVWEAQYASKKTDKAFLLQYLKKRQNLGLDNGEVIDQYAAIASEEELLSKTVLDLLLEEQKVRVDGPYYVFLSKNKARVAEVSGAPVERLNGQLEMYVRSDLQRAIDKGNAALMEKIVTAMSALPARDSASPERAADSIRLRFYSETDNEAETIKVLERHAPRVAQRDRKEIEAADAAGAKQFEAMLKAAPAPADADPEQMEQMRRMQSKRGSMDYAFALREVAGAALKAVNDKKVLGKALGWIQIAETYSDNFTIAETKAGLLYKIGRTSEAMQELQKAIASFDAMKIPADSIRSRMTTSLEKMRAGKPTWLAEKASTVALPR